MSSQPFEVDPDALTRFEEALHGLMDGPLVVHWTVLAEVVDSDGETTMQTVNSKGISAWLELGMLELRRGTILNRSTAPDA